MNAKLKSLKDFEKNESTMLTKNELAKISGGMIKRWVERTNVNGCEDKSYMRQNYRWNGKEYVPSSLAFQESMCWEELDCQPY